MAPFEEWISLIVSFSAFAASACICMLGLVTCLMRQISSAGGGFDSDSAGEGE